MAQASRQRHNGPAHIAVELVEDDGDWSQFENVDALVQQAADAVAQTREEGSAPAFVSVALSSDANVSALNGQFRSKPMPTNVLSFPANKGAPKDFLGDIILAHETILREADEQDTSPKDHLRHIVVHGLLHLLGYDHQTDDEAERMEALEIKILETIGIANPYTGALEPATRE